MVAFRRALSGERVPRVGILDCQAHLCARVFDCASGAMGLDVRAITGGCDRAFQGWLGAGLAELPEIAEMAGLVGGGGWSERR
jgi:hypothetical protein